jgi:hypothetical protein
MTYLISSGKSKLVMYIHVNQKPLIMMLPNVMYVQVIFGLPEPINVIILN